MGSPYLKQNYGRKRVMIKGRADGVAYFDSEGSLAAATSINRIKPINTRKNFNKVNKMTIPRGENFATCYMELCKQQRVRPLPVICVTLPYSLDLTTDRVKMDDWGPILNSLSLDRSLKSVSVRSRYKCRKPLEEINSEDKARDMGIKRHKEPVVLTRYLLEWLSQSVAQCLRNSRALTWLELEGVPLPIDCLAALCVGLAATTSLRRLSLRRCCIGDNGCELVCRTVADIQCLRSLDLSECDLSEKCATALATALSRQKLVLYHETWKESLRYREPNLEAMPGLRRLTLNENPRLGDRAVSQIIEAIRDSLWLKALDLQHCGLTDTIGQEIINLLEHNTTLAIVDVRMNWNLSEETLRKIYERLEANGGNTIGSNGKLTYMWISLTQNYQRNKVSSAGAIRKKCYEDPPNNVYKVRPKSAFTRKNITRPYGVNGIVKSTRISGSMPIVNRTTIPSSENKAFARNNNKNNNNNKITLHDEKSVETHKPKLSLCLDLQSRIESTVVNIETIIPQQDEQSSDKEIRSDIVATKDDARINKSVAQQSRNDGFVTKETEEHEKMITKEPSKILRELSEARMEQERLFEETKRTEMLLSQERIRRESAETKLRRMKENLSDLEKALKKKERETRGFLLVSQRSLDDIATSFDRLLVMLENSVSNERNEAATRASAALPHAARYTEDEYSLARAEIRTRVAHLIRKTKSESNHGKRSEFRVDCEETSVIEASDTATARIFARSEGDVTSSAVPSIIPPIRLERNIGDSPDVVSSRTRATRQSHHVTYRQTSRKDNCNDITDSCSSYERARAIFARIVNGETFLHLDDDNGS